jgi:hypothetical protein
MSELLNTTLQAQMYSTRAFDKELRGGFRFTVDPYDGEGGQEARDYLKSLGVFFYRDTMHGPGILIEPDDSDETPIYDRSGFLAYKCSCLLVLETAEVARWDKTNPAKFRKVMKKWGDDRAWTIYNKQVTIVEVSEVRVVTS